MNYVIGFVLALGVVILVHEYGHYFVARACGVKVLRFSLGFGRPIFSRRAGRHGTEWAIGLFPLGGYVKMLDEREAPVAAHELDRAFNRQSVWKRMAIVVAGPLANFILAIFIFWILLMVGIPGMRPILGEPVKSSPAYMAELHKGDRITHVAGAPVATWQDVRWQLLDRVVELGTVDIQVRTPEATSVTRQLKLSGLSKDELDGDLTEKLGLTQYAPPTPPVVAEVIAGSAAHQAGLAAGDEIVAIDGRPVSDWAQLVQVVEPSAGKPLRFSLRRQGKVVDLTITPLSQQKQGAMRGMIGAKPRVDEALWKDLIVDMRYGPIDAFAKASYKTWETSIFSLKMIGKMITGGVSWKNLSGPLTIADYAGQTFKLGALPYLNFIFLISISIGVLNLLPIPILDGGQLMYYIAELIKGSPVPERVLEIGQQVGMTLLIMLMLFAFYNDFNRLFTG